MRGCLLGLMLAAALPVQGAGAAGSVLDGQVRVLKQLLEEGVVEAAYHLAMLARAHPDRPVFAAGQGRVWLAEAAAGGHRTAIRSLGLTLLESGDEYQGAVLIAAAALLGDSRAAADLKLLPRFTDLSAARTAAASNRALERLAASRVIDCREFPDPCPARAAEPVRLKPGDLLRLRVLRDHGPYDLAGVESLLDPVLAGYRQFDEAAGLRFQQRQRAENRPVFDAADLIPEPAPSPYRGRKQMRARAAAQALGASIEQDLERHRGEIERLLEAINRHRSAADQIALDMVLGHAGKAQR